MKLRNWMTLAAGALVIAACDSSKATAPDATLDAQFDAIDPVVTIFNASYGLPDGPFALAGAMPFMGNFAMPGGASIQRPPSFGPGANAGAPMPDSIKLTAAQKTQIQTLVNNFQTANKADIDAMAAAHAAARVAHQAGKTREEIKAILDGAKAAADRVRANGEALHTAIQAVLTPLQRAWIDSHRPTVPFRLG